MPFLKDKFDLYIKFIINVNFTGKGHFEFEISTFQCSWLKCSKSSDPKTVIKDAGRYKSMINTYNNANKSASGAFC